MNFNFFKENLKLIIGVLIIILVIVSGTYAWYVYSWIGNIAVNVQFSELDDYLDYRVYSIDSSGNETTNSSNAIGSRIEFSKKDIASNLNIYGNLYLQIDSASGTSNVNLFKSSSHGWVLCGVSRNSSVKRCNSSNIISRGNFVGESTGKTGTNGIPMSLNIIMGEDTDYIVERAYSCNNSSFPGFNSATCYTSSVNSNVNISGLSLTTSIYAEANTYTSVSDASTKRDTLYIRSIQYIKYGSLYYLKGITAYSSKNPISGYMLTSSSSPSYSSTSWTSVTCNSSTTNCHVNLDESGYVWESPSFTITTAYRISSTKSYLCIKNSNNKVYCKNLSSLLS